MEPLFVEVQRFRQPWVWALLLAAIAVAAISLSAVGERPGRAVAAGALGAVIAVGLLVAVARLTVAVRGDGIHFRFTPFHFRDRFVARGEIAGHAAVTYDPIREYGGWGMRGWGARRAYNVSGNRGVLVTLSDGRTILFGSQRADELASAITRARG